MVNRGILYFILTVLVSGCCYIGKRTMYGLPRKRIQPLKGGNISDKYIDTTVLYKLAISYHYNTSLKKYSYFEAGNNISYPYISYLKFYSNGKLGLFVIPKNDTNNLTKDTFNPLKAKMGYYIFKNNVLSTKIATIGNCSLYISVKSSIL